MEQSFESAVSIVVAFVAISWPGLRAPARTRGADTATEHQCSVPAIEAKYCGVAQE